MLSLLAIDAHSIDERQTSHEAQSVTISPEAALAVNSLEATDIGAQVGKGTGAGERETADYILLQ